MSEEHGKSVQEWVNQRIQQREAGDHESALISFTKVLELEPNHVETRYKQAETLSHLNRIEEAITAYQSCYESATEAKNSWYQAAAQYSLGVRYKSLQKSTESAQAYAQAYRLFRQIKNEQWTEAAWKELTQFTDNYMAVNQYAEAIPLYQVQRDLLQEFNDQKVLCAVLENLGKAQYYQNDYQSAIESHTLMLEIARFVEDKVKESLALGWLGCDRWQANQLDFALHYFQQRLTLAKSENDSAAQKETLGWLVSVGKQLGKDTAMPCPYMMEQIELFRQLGETEKERSACYELGNWEFDIKQYQAAVESFALAANLGEKINKASAYFMLGQCYRMLEQQGEAISNYQKAADLYIQHDNPEWAAKALDYLGPIYKSLKEYEKAIEAQQQRLKLVQAMGDNRFNEFVINYELGCLYNNNQQHSSAIEYLTAALTLANELQQKGNAANAHYMLGSVYEKLEQLDEAIDHYRKAESLYIETENQQWGEKSHTKVLELPKKQQEVKKQQDMEEKITVGINTANIQEALPEKDAIFWFDKGTQQIMLGNYELALADLDRAIEINPNLSNAWTNRGGVLNYLSRYDEAIESLNRAIKIDPDNHHAWCSKSFVLLKMGQYQEAMAASDRGLVLDPDCPTALYTKGQLLTIGFQKNEEAFNYYNRSLILNPKNSECWKARGFVLVKLERTEEAIESFNKATNINRKDYESWNNLRILLQNSERYEESISASQHLLEVKINDFEFWHNYGTTLLKLNQYEEAIKCFDHAIDINHTSFESWCSKGLAWWSFGQAGFRFVAQKELAEALICFNRAVELNPISDIAWYNRGNILWHRGCYKEAIESFDRAIDLTPNFPMAWKMRALALDALGNVHESLTSLDRALELSNYQLVDAWVERGSTLFSLGRDTEAVQNYDDALRLIKKEDQEILGNLFPYKAICMRLLQQKADVLYHIGLATTNHLKSWEAAREIYRQALELQEDEEKSVSTLEKLVIVCRALSQTNEAQELLREGTDQLQRHIENIPSPRQKVLTARVFASFNQLRVDQLIEQGKAIAALELAEERKNTCLSWLRHGWSDTVPSPKYQDIQQLLNPHTAAIYWHLSPAAITTFILKHNQPLVTLVLRYDRPPSVFSNEATPDDATYADAARKLYRLEKWIAIWKKDYQNQKQHWRDEMPNRLATLGILLDIPEIVTYLTGIDNLILFPHRDLHLLPLEALFPQQFTITRLPSAQIGLEKLLEQRFRDSSPENPYLLSVENPRKDLPFASVEAGAIKQLYLPSCQLPGDEATYSNVMTALQAGTAGAIFHFAGHGQHEFAEPLESALLLAGTDRLSLGDIFQLDLSRYFLVFLSACETGITGKKDLIDEFVGLVSAFQAVGASHVVGTLWTVNDISTSWLTQRFYENLKKSMPVSVALKEAKYSLRNLTLAQLEQWLETANLPLTPTQELDLFSRLSKMEPTDTPFESPYYWAAFCAVGQ